VAGVETKIAAGDEQLYLGEAIEFFLNSKRAGGRSEKTIDDYRKKLELFQRWVSGEEFDAPYTNIGADEIESYMVHLKDEREMADSSRKNHLAVLRSFFKTVSKRLKVLDPSLELDEARFHQQVPKRNFLSKREADLLLAAVDAEVTKDTDDVAGVGHARRVAMRRALASRDHGAFSAMIYAGLRIEETTALKVDDLDFSRGEEEVRVARGKGNKERRVPMHPKLKKSLRRYLKLRDGLASTEGDDPGYLFLNNKGARITENTVRRTLYKYVRKSGLRKKDLHPHDLRRTFGTWFLQQNPDKARELAELMGHSDLSQVMKYALSDQQRARAGVARL